MSAPIFQNDLAVKLVTSYLKADLPKDAESSLQQKLANLSLSSTTQAIHTEVQQTQGAFGVNTTLLKLSLEKNPAFTGETEEQKAKCSQWMTMSARTGTVNRQLFAQSINDEINSKFLLSTKVSLCDLVALANISAFMGTLSTIKRKNLSKFSDWYFSVQETVGKDVLLAAGIQPLESAVDKSAAAASNAEKSAELKKKAKEAKKTTKKPQNQPKVEVKTVPSMIDLRVGKIVHVEKHPDADSLYLEKIDVGEEEPRQVISGLVKYIPIEEMNDRMIITICNLKPATMRGIKSYAMVLCADSPDGSKVEFVEPPAGSKPGDRVYFEGFDGQEPETLLNPKKKIWETIQTGLFTSDDCVAGWYDENKKFYQLLVNGNICKSKTIANGIMK
ncbi:hypothetical protein BB561_004956 [Smittium simulii]|uniref:tRNA-binding domain-containing protein n=1 Tax=Smittium simulii TaxID=133385 RepID=A0A2T9YD30_9FUNG|nr:hypothetical protein BB561_004956 [Smittium simulii]